MVAVDDALSPIPFNNINEVISRSIWLPDSDVRIANSVFTEDCLDLVVIDVCEWNGIRNGNATFFFPADDNRRRFLI